MRFVFLPSYFLWACIFCLAAVFPIQSFFSEDNRATQGTEDDAPYAHHRIRCSHVNVERVDEIYRFSHPRLEHADPDHEATCIPGTSDLTPVSSADIPLAHEDGVGGRAGYDSGGGSALTNDGEKAQKTNKPQQSRFLRSSRFRSTRYKPRIAPTVTLSRSPLKQIRHSSSDSNLKKSLYTSFGYRWRKYRSVKRDSQRYPSQAIVLEAPYTLLSTRGMNLIGAQIFRFCLYLPPREGNASICTDLGVFQNRSLATQFHKIVTLVCYQTRGVG